MEEQVSAHYNSEDLKDKIFKALENLGRDITSLTPKELAPIDQLHTGGAWATRAVLELAGIEPGSRILDAGCGIGGSSRLMADESGHRVTGIDLSDEFIRAARALTESTLLSDRVEFRQGSILDMPFEDQSFDAVLCQHVLMNIEDKPAALTEFHRVLRPGGKLILHEVVKGQSGPAAYPVPWASGPEISHLESSENTGQWIREAGFAPASEIDGTPKALQWWLKAKAAAKKNAAPGTFGPALIFGENASRFGVNMSANLETDCIRVIEAVFEKEPVK